MAFALVIGSGYFMVMSVELTDSVLEGCSAVSIARSKRAGECMIVSGERVAIWGGTQALLSAWSGWKIT